MILGSSCNPILGSWVIKLRWIHPRSRVWVLSTQRSSWFSSNFILRCLLKHIWCIWVVSSCSRSTLLVFVHLCCLRPSSKTVFRWLNFINKTWLISSRPRSVSSSCRSRVGSSWDHQSSRSSCFCRMTLDCVISRSRDPTFHCLISTSCSKTISRGVVFCEWSCGSVLARAWWWVPNLFVSAFSSKTFATLSVYCVTLVIRTWTRHVEIQMIFISSAKWPSSFLKTWLMLISSWTWSLLLSSKI